jgi:hypothetical protein
VPKKLVGVEILDVDIDQLVAVAIDGVVAHLLEDVLVDLKKGDGVAHVDGVPHRQVLAEVVPR